MAPSPKPVSLKEIARRAAMRAERGAILAALHSARWNRRKAARLLGISYNTLRNKIRAYGLNAD